MLNAQGPAGNDAGPVDLSMMLNFDGTTSQAVLCLDAKRFNARKKKGTSRPLLRDCKCQRPVKDRGLLATAPDARYLIRVRRFVVGD